MTDKELIRAFRVCRKHSGCAGCPIAHDFDDCIAIGEFSPHALIERLEALLAENERLKAGKDTNVPAKWVSVEERLPRYNRDVLCYRPEMAMKVVVCSYDGYYGEDDNEWYEEWSNFGYDADGNCLITHWMPLPKPPSTEGVE